MFTSNFASCVLTDCKLNVADDHSGSFALYTPATAMSGASASGSGVITFTAAGYLPLGVKKKFQLQCAGGVVSPEIPVTVYGPCQISGKTLAQKTLRPGAATTIAVTDIFDGTRPGCAASACVLKVDPQNTGSFQPYAGLTGYSGVTVGDAGAVTITVSSTFKPLETLHSL
jgi:hypothetical protein